MQKTPIIKKTPHITEKRDTLFHFLSPMLKMSEIRPIRAPILSSILTCVLEKPVNCFFSVPVENMPYNRPVCRNTADLHLTPWLVRPFKLR
jgi:hypothetical protein